MIVADLHIHSRYSRATARNLDPEHLWLWAQLKGVDLVGTGDFTHPAWVEELKEKLIPTGDGAYELRPELARDLADQVPPACRRPVRFLLSGEISSIYKRGGATRKVHNLILMPDLEAVERLDARLDKLGNILSDGRPILGLDSRDLLELCLEVEPSVIFIPAHIWTPWFSLFGSKSGFDRIEDCYADLTGHIHALETGLSSDPAMNWRLSALDGYTLVSNSDAHSPAKLAREANLLDRPATYPDLAAALADPSSGWGGTLEFFPDEGKYHLDGHRKCGVRLSPAETRALDGRCPVCGGKLTVGVLSRVEDLADRPEDYRPPAAAGFESLVPLDEVLGEVRQRGPATKGVQAELRRLQAELGPELFILRQAPLEDLEGIGGPVLAEAIRRMRAGEVICQGGYDGEFGKIGLFTPREREALKGQKGFWAPEKAPAPARAAQTSPPPPPLFAAAPEADPALAPLDPAREGLNPEQRAAVEHRGGHLIVRAGPGTGKTRMLVSRAAALVEEGVDAARLCLVTFTRKAAAELAQRLAELVPAAGTAWVGTFHALGREVLALARGESPAVLDEAEREAIIRPLARRAQMDLGAASLALSVLKQRLDLEPPPALAGLWTAYQAELAGQGLLDLDDLVREAVLALRADPGLAGVWQGLFGHLLVDEYQDVNPAQVGLLQALNGPQARITAIGDPDQAIYAFRGADPSLFARFGQDFPGAADLGLRVNYRSRSPILDLAQGLMAAAPDPARSALAAAAGQGPLPILCALASPEAEAAWIADRVTGLLGGLDSRQVEAGVGEGGEGGGATYAAGEIAVLYRLHAQAEIIAAALERAGVPIQVASREPLAETDPLDFKAQRVSLLSMHAAKGLEWPVVFLAGLGRGVIPYEPPGREPAGLDEERRLLYVALTRARERLFLTWPRGRRLFGQAWEGPSPLLAALPAGALQEVKPPARRRKARQMDLFG